MVADRRINLVSVIPSWLGALYCILIPKQRIDHHSPSNVTEGRADGLPGSGARMQDGFGCANSPCCEVNHEGNGFRKIEALLTGVLTTALGTVGKCYTECGSFVTLS